MRIHVQGVDSSYYIDIERMINLFFSEAKVVQDPKNPEIGWFCFRLK